MPTLNTKDLLLWNRMSYNQEEKMLMFAHETAIPPQQAPKESGKFRVGEAQADYKELDMDRLSKYDVPQHYGKTDSFRYYSNKPIGAGFSISNADLDDPEGRGYMSIGEWLDDYRRWITRLSKKFLEKAFYAVVSDNDNFTSASYYANATTAWSSVGTANTKDDVEAGRIVSPYINAVTLGWTGLRYALRNETFRSSAYVSGPARDNLEVTPGLKALADYWEVDYIFVSRCRLQTDSSDSTDTTETDIWGDKVLLHYHDPNPSNMESVWLRHNYWAPMGKGAGTGGWFWNFDEENRSGGVGSQSWDFWKYYEFITQQKDLAYRIDNIY